MNKKIRKGREEVTLMGFGCPMFRLLGDLNRGGGKLVVGVN